MLEIELAQMGSLGQVLSWAGTTSKAQFSPQIVTDVIAQDEYTHDVIVPFRDIFLVFDTT